jgi:uncharacterized membrane-anchored protein YhcB (DUF1043 family)
MKKSFTYYAIWAIYILILAVMVPHSQWSWRQLEPANSPIILTGWLLTWADVIALAAAVAFEGGVAVFTHRLAKKIESVKKQYRMKGGVRTYDTWATFFARYGNSFTVALLFCAGVSGIANYFHALQFGVDIVAFSKWSWFRDLFPLAFGAALPVISLVFANALTTVNDDEAEDDPALTELKTKNIELNKAYREQSNAFSKLQQDFNALKEGFSKVTDELKIALDALKVREDELNATTEQVKSLQERLNNTPDFAKALFSEDAKDRVVGLKQLYPTLPNAAVAIMAKVSAGRVSQILKDFTLPVEIKQEIPESK